MKKTNNLVTKSVAVLALLGALPVAARQTTYPGALCEPVSGSETPTLFASGRLLNHTSGLVNVVCPLQREVIAPSYTEDMTILVTVQDLNPSKDFCCWATVAQSDATTLVSTPDCTETFGSATQVLSINLPSVYASIDGYLSLRCEVPEQHIDGNGIKYTSALASFLVME